MFWEITVTDQATYRFDAECYSKGQAIELAKDWFNEREPSTTVVKLAPCQMDGACPYSADHTCSMCMKGGE